MLPSEVEADVWRVARDNEEERSLDLRIPTWK